MMKNTDNDKLKNTVQNNPCGICRSAGLPICKGHGGGGGGGGGSYESQEKKESGSFSEAPSPENIMSKAAKIELVFQASDLWEVLKNEDNAFEYQNANSLFNLTLDMHECKLTFTQKEDLSPEEKNKLSDYYDAIKKEFADFKTQLKNQGVDVSRMQLIDLDGKLQISIPSTQHFDAFVDRLLQANMLPLNASMNANQQYNPNAPQNPEATSKSTAPNPFNMNGPKPKGWDDVGG